MPGFSIFTFQTQPFMNECSTLPACLLGATVLAIPTRLARGDALAPPAGPSASLVLLREAGRGVCVGGVDCS